MRFTVVDMRDYLRADLLDRETAGETEQFLTAVKEAGLEHRSRRILIRVYSPRAIFKVEQYHASMFIDELAARPSFKVALVARHFEVRLVHQYLEVLARSKRAHLRSFADESAAIRWLMIPGPGSKFSAQGERGAEQK